MAPSTSASTRRSRFRRVLATAAIVILLWDGTALAINAFVSQDLPILVEIAATEMSSYLELGAILAETAAVVEQVKEYTNIAKTAWGALDELRRLTPEELGRLAVLGLDRAFPEARDIYGDVQDIRDLDYRDYRAYQTLRGVLWEEVYGPAIDYVHSGHSNLDALASMQDHRGRQRVKIEARRTQLDQWQDDCELGEGACTGAAHRAEIQQALLLTEMHETQLYLLDAEERSIQQADRRELDEVYAYQRWIHDIGEAIAADLDPRSCPAGQCLSQPYGSRMLARISEYRRRHPDEAPVLYHGAE